MLTYQFCIKSRLSITGGFPFSFIGQLEHPVALGQLLIFLPVPRLVEHEMKLPALDIILRDCIKHLPDFRYLAPGIVVEIIYEQVERNVAVRGIKREKEISDKDKERIPDERRTHTPSAPS